MLTMPPGIRTAFHLRSPSRSGGKDWIGGVDENGTMHSWWGKTGQIHQHASKAGGLMELDRVIGRKLAKGYRKIATFQRHAGWSYLRPHDPHPPPRPRQSIALPRGKDTLAWDF